MSHVVAYYDHCLLVILVTNLLHFVYLCAVDAKTHPQAFNSSILNACYLDLHPDHMPQYETHPPQEM